MLACFPANNSHLFLNKLFLSPYLINFNSVFFLSNNQKSFLTIPNLMNNYNSHKIIQNNKKNNLTNHNDSITSKKFTYKNYFPNRKNNIFSNMFSYPLFKQKLSINFISFKNFIFQNKTKIIFTSGFFATAFLIIDISLYIKRKREEKTFRQKIIEMLNKNNPSLSYYFDKMTNNFIGENIDKIISGFLINKIKNFSLLNPDVIIDIKNKIIKTFQNEINQQLLLGLLKGYLITFKPSFISFLFTLIDPFQIFGKKNKYLKNNNKNNNEKFVRVGEKIENFLIKIFNSKRFKKYLYDSIYENIVKKIDLNNYINKIKLNKTKI